MFIVLEIHRQSKITLKWSYKKQVLLIRKDGLFEGDEYLLKPLCRVYFINNVNFTVTGFFKAINNLISKYQCM
ncbi:hypothetical protein GAB14E_4105 [Colwellia psychrerythraea]|uniref:Uncharacterized protein n=1 Tax=Colwellia psychrerythraea TaxID=28229 RepID=A0A099KEF5_COLPS|nr:hypothetical protein GAB14E_4105 [Colwellia psychrerythraea]